MATTRRDALAMIMAFGGFTILLGCFLGPVNGWVDFRAVYYGTRCLLEHHNPYNVSELESVYRADGGERPGEKLSEHQAVVLYVNVPTAFIFVAPFAMLPWGVSHWLWFACIAGIYLLAVLLIWSVGARYSSDVSFLLTLVLLFNSLSFFVAGNTAGIVVGLCVVAVWCFLEERFVLAGVLCLALSLAIKPHDTGFVWLYFVLAGGVNRKRALQSLLITTVMGLSACLWLSHVAPHWIADWQSNLATISAPGGINEPGPSSLTGRSASTVVDLQAAISIFRDDPRFYNPASYLVCGALLLLWSARAYWTRFSQPKAWLALASVSALTMLVTYHRPWDAKLIMLAIPACAMIWAKGGPARWPALLVTAAGVIFTGDYTLAILSMISDNLHINTTGIFGKILTVMLIRPASLALLVMGVFYLWLFLRRTAPDPVSEPG
jgi:hypothetical protein